MWPDSETQQQVGENVTVTIAYCRDSNETGSIPNEESQAEDMLFYGLCGYTI